VVMKRRARNETLVATFLFQKLIAVLGVLGKWETAYSQNDNNLNANEYHVYADNRRLSASNGEPCYRPELKFIPEKTDAIFILNNFKVTEQVVQQHVNSRYANSRGDFKFERVKKYALHVISTVVHWFRIICFTLGIFDFFTDRSPVIVRKNAGYETRNNFEVSCR
jgi:predicted CoA-binding protein